MEANDQEFAIDCGPYLVIGANVNGAGDSLSRRVNCPSVVAYEKRKQNIIDMVKVPLLHDFNIGALNA